ncbi:hypothetical protein EVAR_64184_1 [Eumeta japonica]|uniref:Uncharacterized protein n=1 Tax=Eumeta variegata TaxID=151549 RepID=A0A4C1ZL57_EUMVA|nr:hypothetical protein EVAR_64184_1 [Eumeta japonica]
MTLISAAGGGRRAVGAYRPRLIVSDNERRLSDRIGFSGRSETSIARIPTMGSLKQISARGPAATPSRRHRIKLCCAVFSLVSNHIQIWMPFLGFLNY